MRIGRFETGKGVSYGIIEGDSVRLLKGEPFAQIMESGEVLPLAGLKVLPPTEPSKIVAVGLNYLAHIQETRGSEAKEPASPILFLKPPSAIVGPGEAIRLPADSAQVDYEAELAAVIGKKLYKATPEEVKEGILGFTLMNDVSARDFQKGDGQWMRAKGCDTFAPYGPFIQTDFDPREKHSIQSLLNGEVRQDSTTDMMIFDPYTLISFISQYITLLPGDAVATGTPSGIGPMKHGDTIVVRVEGVGELSNPVVNE